MVTGGHYSGDIDIHCKGLWLQTGRHYSEDIDIHYKDLWLQGDITVMT